MVAFDVGHHDFRCSAKQLTKPDRFCKLQLAGEQSDEVDLR